MLLPARKKPQDALLREAAGDIDELPALEAVGEASGAHIPVKGQAISASSSQLQTCFPLVGEEPLSAAPLLAAPGTPGAKPFRFAPGSFFRPLRNACPVAR